MTEENKDLEIQVSTPEPPKLEIVKDAIPLFLKIIMVVGIAGWFGIIVHVIFGMELQE